jgi:hypothetical protein
MIMKFGALGISPPMQRSELAETGKQIAGILDALAVTGQMEQEEGRARLTKDESVLSGENYIALVKRHKNQNEETLKRLY